MTFGDACMHDLFTARVAVVGVAEIDGGPVTGFIAQVQVICATCQVRFRFGALAPGFSTVKPTTNIDGSEVYLPMAPLVSNVAMPAEEKPN